MLHTSCKDCVFAKYEGKTQVGCAFNNRTEKYAEQGVLVEAYDNDKEFYLIVGRKCYAQRIGGLPLVDQVRGDIAQRVDIIILMQEPTTLEQLAQTFDSVKAQTKAANAVYIINNQDNLTAPQLHRWLMKNGGELKWTMSDILDRNPDGGRLSRGEVIDMTAGKLRSHFYGVFSAGAIVPAEYVASIDRAIVDDMKRFVVLTSDSGEGLTVATHFHNNILISGNKPTNVKIFDNPNTEEPGPLLSLVEDKAKFLVKEKGMTYLVARLEDVCPGM